MNVEAEGLRPISDPALWVGKDLDQDRSWYFALDEEELRDLQVMAEDVRSRIGEDANALLSLTRQDFRLGAFECTVDRIYDVLKDAFLIVALERCQIGTDSAPFTVMHMIAIETGC